jgi:hypothetical protein
MDFGELKKLKKNTTKKFAKRVLNENYFSIINGGEQNG